MVCEISRCFPRIVDPLPPMFRQYRELARGSEAIHECPGYRTELNLVRLRSFPLDDMPVIGCELRMQPLEYFQRIDDVLGRYGYAVVPFRGRAQTEAHPGEIGGITRRLGDESVFAGDLVQRRRHEGIVDGLDALCQITLHSGDNHIEAVVSSDRRAPGRAALGRLRIDVVKMREPGGIFQIPQTGYAMRPGGFTVRRTCGRRCRRDLRAVHQRGERYAPDQISASEGQGVEQELFLQSANSALTEGAASWGHEPRTYGPQRTTLSRSGVTHRDNHRTLPQPVLVINLPTSRRARNYFQKKIKSLHATADTAMVRRRPKSNCEWSVSTPAGGGLAATLRPFVEAWNHVPGPSMSPRSELAVCRWADFTRRGPDSIPVGAFPSCDELGACYG